ncbi:MAG: DNA polymerase III subunit gamma/tau [Betaproteobacteria bacterium]|nr:DNA polymerase III subunit gamma/tau [Betaproteobacteria bacterium]
MNQVLARKWRPRIFSELVGQEHVVRALTNALTQQRLHHAYLFTGTRGVGKTTLARIIAKALNCETGITAEPCGKCAPCVEIDAGRFVDLIELDAASNTQVDNMRDLLENALYAPTTGRFKVYIIDEVHMLSRSAFNAMLKTLEEPPGHVKFILATTDPQKIPVTVLSRCLQFNLKRIPQPQIKAQLKKVLELEDVACEDEALTLLARAAHGSMRDSLSLLDQAIAHGGGRVEQQAVRAMLGSVEQEYLHDILSALTKRDGAAMLAVADRMAERSLSFEIALQELATFLHRIALAQMVPDAVAADDPQHVVIAAFAAELGAEEIQLLYQIALHGRQDIGLAPDDYAGFTMTLMRMLAFMPEGGSLRPERPAAAESKAPVRASPPPDSKKKPADGDWNALVSRLPLAGMERMLAHNCELVAWHDGAIELRVPHAQRHLVERAYQNRLKLALEQHLGTGVRLEISVGAVGGNTLAAVQERENQQRQSEAAAAIDGDPFVRELIEQLDARVLSSTIKPVP